MNCTVWGRQNVGSGLLIVTLACVGILGYGFSFAAEADGRPDYTLVAMMGTYDVDLEYAHGIKTDQSQEAAASKVGRFKFLTRSWAKDGVLDDNMLGPTMEFRPGQHVEILVKNELYETGEYRNLGPPEPQPSDWLPLIDRKKGASAYLHSLDPLGFNFLNRCTPDTPLSEFTIDHENIPGDWNFTNLHVHGLEVIPHLFYPQGTSNPKADYITIKPGEQYLYKFDIPNDHPTGTFWYHPHRHNSVAMQAWGGMAGLIYIRGITDNEVRDKYGIKREIPFVVHDPHYRIESAPTATKPGIAKPGRFLQNQNEQTDYTYLVTGKYHPTFVLKRNEVIRLRMLIATAENLVGFRIVPKQGSSQNPLCKEGPRKENCPFHVMASDGVTYARPMKRDLIVGGGGERHDILLSFSEPGDYLVKSDFLGHIQFFGTGPKDQLLATIRISDENAGPLKTPIADMTFTPGIAAADSIEAHEITRKRHVVFDLEGDTCTVPFPQFRINDERYRADDVTFSSTQGKVEEWVLVNPNRASHPFHIHVNAFQVKEMRTALEPDPKLVPPKDLATVRSRIQALTTARPIDQWRDTIVIPPQGYLRIWTRMYSRYVGKTVFHCHFLAHEETSMIQNFLIKPHASSTAPPPSNERIRKIMAASTEP